MSNKDICWWKRIQECKNCGYKFNNHTGEDYEVYWTDGSNIRVVYYRTCPKCNKTWCCVDVYEQTKIGEPFEQRATP